MFLDFNNLGFIRMMTNKLFGKIYDNRRSDSWASDLRSKRVNFLESLITSIPTPMKILDLGGTPEFWEHSGFLNNNQDIDITFLNIEVVEHPNFKCLIGDGRDLSRFANEEFDLVFSNSVIEHVGNYQDQGRMADEIKRVSKRYFVQTPNLYFPIEPHFLFPFFQFLPVGLKVWLFTNFDMGWYSKISDEQKARDLAVNTQLLSKKKLMGLFPEANLYEEKVLGLIKSFIVYHG